jgi:histidine ammonia-lyase
VLRRFQCRSPLFTVYRAPMPDPFIGGESMGAAPAVVVLSDDTLGLAEFLAVCSGAELLVGETIWHRIKSAQLDFEELLQRGATVYGVTTGYGAGSSQPIAPDERAAFQAATIRSHACGTGPPLSWNRARGVWLAKILSISTGLTGAGAMSVESMVTLLNAGFAPVIPSLGSLGASGDLIPSGHAALVLLGEGEVIRKDGTMLSGELALRSAQVKVLDIGPRDGLSLVNGTAMTLSLTAHVCAEASRFIALTEWVAAAGMEAFGGHADAMSPTIVNAKAHPGASEAAANVQNGLVGVEPSRLARQGLHDPYAWRCLPQVHGAARDAVGWATTTCETELQGCSDNPILSADGAIVSGGNFHSAPLGLVADMVRLAVGEVAALSRQRVAHLTTSLNRAGSDGSPVEGVGLTMVLTTATASLMKISSTGVGTGHWLPIDSVEDHVPNSTIAALHALDVLAQCRAVVAAEAVATVAMLQRADGPPTSEAARWLISLLDGIAGTLRLDQSLAPVLARLADVIAGADRSSIAIRHPSEEP